MSNAHDVLYPSRQRTHSLVTYGEYFKYMDDVRLSLPRLMTRCRLTKVGGWPRSSIFPSRHSKPSGGESGGFDPLIPIHSGLNPSRANRWQTFPLTDIVWCMFHYGKGMRTQLFLALADRLT